MGRGSCSLLSLLPVPACVDCSFCAPWSLLTLPTHWCWAQATSQAALLCGCQPPHTHTPHTGVRPKLPPKLHFCVVASHHTHTPHTGTHPIAVVPLRPNAVQKKKMWHNTKKNMTQKRTPQKKT